MFGVYAGLNLKKQLGDAWQEALRVLEWMERDDLKADELLGSCLLPMFNHGLSGAKKGKTLIHSSLPIAPNKLLLCVCFKLSIL